MRLFNSSAAARAERLASATMTLRNDFARSAASVWNARLLALVPPSFTPRALAALMLADDLEDGNTGYLIAAHAAKSSDLRCDLNVTRITAPRVVRAILAAANGNLRTP